MTTALSRSCPLVKYASWSEVALERPKWEYFNSTCDFRHLFICIGLFCGPLILIFDVVTKKKEFKCIEMTWTCLIVLVGLFLSSWAEQFATVESIESLRRRAHELKVPFLPPSSSEIMLNSACQNFGRACPVEYELWLSQQLSLDLSPVDGQAEVSDQAVRSEHRHQELLSERLLELQAEGIQLASTLELLGATRDAYGCNNAAFSMPQGRNMQLSTLLTAVLSPDSIKTISTVLRCVIETRDAVCEFPFSTLAHALGLALLNFWLLTWITVGGRISKAHFDLLCDNNVQPAKRYQHALTFVKFSAVIRLCKLRLVVTAVFFAASTYAVLSLPAAFRDSKLRSIANWFIPSSYLNMSTVVFGVVLVWAPAAKMLQEFHNAWSDLIMFESRECDARGRVLLDIFQ